MTSAIDRPSTRCGVEVVKAAFFLFLPFILTCCASADLAFLAVKVQRTELRRFPPGEPPPLYVNVRVLRSDRLLGSPVVNRDLAWEELQPDPQTGKRWLEIAVPANQDKDFDYLLRLSSVIATTEGGLWPDECGVAAYLKAAAGEQVPVEVVVHPGECSRLLCQRRSDCIGEQRFCLSFECYDWQLCGRCPEGAGCDSLGFCTGECASDTDCTASLRCCRGTCARNCPDW
jgi:hypothetical protein